MKLFTLTALAGLTMLSGCFSEIKGSGTPDEIAARASELIDKGDTDSAILQLNYLISETPEYVPAYCLRANAYAKAQKYPQAIDNYTRVIELSSTTDCGSSGSVFYDRGYAYFLSGKPLSAAQDFVREVQRNPTNGSAYGLMGRALRDECFFARDAGMEDWRPYCLRALESFDKSYNLCGGTQPYFNKAVVYNSMDYYKNALLELDKLQASGGGDASAEDIAYQRGLAQLGLGNYAAAAEEFTETLFHDSDNYEYYYRRGLAYAGMQNYDAAISDFSTSLSFRAGFAPAMQARAEAAQKLDQTRTTPPPVVDGYIP